MPTNAAIIASAGLGDGLIQLVLARNLRLAGYEVTFYCNPVAELDDYLPGISAMPFPDEELIREELANQHLVLYDSDSAFVRALPDSSERWLASNGICYSLSRNRPAHKAVSEKRIRQRLPDEKKSEARKLIALNRRLPLRPFDLYRKPLSRQLADFVADTLDLGHRAFDAGLKIPPENQVGHSNQVVIHPTSSDPRKNWLPTRFMELAGRLKQDGWLPVITVAPEDRDRWLEFTGGIVDVPLFNSVKTLAECYAGSAAFIGNDSDSAHLASCLGLPNIVVYRRWQRFPRRRPGWKKPVLVYPRTLKNEDWQQKITVDRVHSAFRQMMGKRRRSSLPFPAQRNDTVVMRPKRAHQRRVSLVD